MYYYFVESDILSQYIPFLTVKAVGFCSLSMWVLCILFAVFAYVMRTNKKLYSIILHSIFNLILLVIVSFIMILLHVKKLTAIQNSPCETRRIERRMNVTVT